MMSFDHIGRHMGIKPQTAKVYYERGLRKLRENPEEILLILAERYECIRQQEMEVSCSSR